MNARDTRELQIEEDIADLHGRLAKATAALTVALETDDDAVDTDALEDEICDLRGEIEYLEDEDGRDEQRSLEAWCAWSRV